MGLQFSFRTVAKLKNRFVMIYLAVFEDAWTYNNMRKATSTQVLLGYAPSVTRCRNLLRDRTASNVLADLDKSIHDVHFRMHKRRAAHHNERQVRVVPLYCVDKISNAVPKDILERLVVKERVYRSSQPSVSTKKNDTSHSLR